MSLAMLITGTDTEVGKTYVGVGLLRALNRVGLKVAPFKPVETGCLKDLSRDGLIPADARLLESASGSSASLDLICPYRFALPAAPMVAAEQERRQIDTTVLDAAFEQLTATHDFVVVESAGGLLVPLDEKVDFSVLARRWKLPVLVVAGSRLGVLNQCLLTIRQLEREGLAIIGVVLNHPYGDRGEGTLGSMHNPALATNAATLRRLLPYQIWEVPFANTRTAAEMDALFDKISDDILRRLHPAS
jgi:dethiobiotin synthetase